MQKLWDAVQGNISKFGVERRGLGKMCFQQKTGHISEMVRERTKVTIEH